MARRGAVLRLGQHWTVVDLAVVTRWATTTVALAGALAEDHGHLAVDRQLVGGLALLMYATVCTLWRAARWPDVATGTRIGTLEMLLCCTVAWTTGGWSSPFVLAVGGALIVSGLLGGRRGVASGVLILAAGVVGSEAFKSPASLSYLAPVRATELAVMGGVGLCVRRALVGLAGSEGELDRLRSAAAVNELLLDLYARTAEQPGALTVDGSVAEVVDRLKRHFLPDVVVLLLRDPASAILDRPWQVAACEGADLPHTWSDEDLPYELRLAARGGSPLRSNVLAPGAGVTPRSTSGLYVPLRAGTALVGLLAIERCGAVPFGEHDVDELADVARHAGLAIENARLFGRLRILGANDERERFARELHDRIGQALASIAMTADRTATGALTASPEDLERDIRSIARDLRGVIHDVRDKLTDLRTEPSEQSPLCDLLAELASRVQARSGLRVSCLADGPALPLDTEREVWRIACEALANAERHAGARKVEVRWTAEAGVPVLEVSDDGNGLLGQRPLRKDAYGVRGMRERAELVGGRLTITSSPGAGTTIRLTLADSGAATGRWDMALPRRVSPRMQEVVA